MTQVQIASYRLSPCNLGQTDPDWVLANQHIPVVNGWLVVLAATTGETGFGHIECAPSGPPSLAHAKRLAEETGLLLIGRNPLDIGPILQRLDDGLVGENQVKSGFDCALHDLCAKLLGLPLHSFLGGAHHVDLDVCRIIPIKSPEAMAQSAKALIDEGYQALKLKLSGQSEQDIRRVRQVRHAVGPHVRLMVDPNQSYTVPEAIRTLPHLAHLGVELCEQPVAKDDLAGLKQVQDTVPMVIEADEAANSPAEVLAISTSKSARSVNIKIADAGGLNAAKRMAEICEAAGLGYRIGAAFGPQLLNAQAAHLAATFPRQDVPHELAEFAHFTADPFTGLHVSKGRLNVSNSNLRCSLSL